MKDISFFKKVLEIYDIFHPGIPLLFLYLNFDHFLTQTVETLMGSLFTSVLLLQMLRFALVGNFMMVYMFFIDFFVHKRIFFLHIKNMFIIVLYFILACFFVHVFIIFYGAPVMTYVWETALCALHLTILGIFPLICVFGIDTEKYVQLFSFELDLRIFQNFKLTAGFLGTFIGAWLGAIPIPLDWDRLWQKWPIPVVVGGYSGYALSIVALLFVYSKEKNPIFKKLK
ncbi:hypothetical protein PORY_000432 [Pneumocystis oryctolagi]|uniref:Uncharacterized protein n=1 Tax=Pneumocystis oryctolagi TaxID=42067 RepID=A0ACB7CF96_9ASCO|nr:hypothetical protein PORY_000432 [Pneumocystis oryctolagi]